jgi:hypothetical protein
MPRPSLPLTPFAAQADGIVRTLEVQVERTSDSSLRFQYTLVAAGLHRVRVPERREPRRAHELWKRTCFEAFIATADVRNGYLELNFSPSTEWAAYSFDSYRAGMAPVTLRTPPGIRVEASDDRLHVDASIDLEGLRLIKSNTRSTKLHLALAAVIEDDSGAISYWALKHAPTRPDFHHPSGFALEV